MARATIRAGPSDPSVGWTDAQPHENTRFEVQSGQQFTGEIGLMGDGDTVYIIKFRESEPVTVMPLSPLSFPIAGLTGPTTVSITARNTSGARRYPFAYFSGSLRMGL